MPNPNHFKQQPTGRATAPVINPVTHDNIMAQFSRNFWWQNDEVINHLEAHNLCPVQDENGKFPVTDIRRATCILESLSEAGFDDADYGFEEVDGLTTNEKGFPVYFAFYDHYDYFLGRISKDGDGREHFRVTNADTFNTETERGIRTDIFGKMLHLTRKEFLEEIDHQLSLFTTCARALATYSA